MTTIRKAVIPVAGYGTRFLPLTKVVPKHLLPIGNKPVIHYVVEEAIRSGIEEIIFICDPQKKYVLDYFKPNPHLYRILEKTGNTEQLEALMKIESMAEFKVAFQDAPLGLGHAVWCAQGLVGQRPFLVLLPDVIVNHQIPASQQLIEKSKNKWGLLLTHVAQEDISAYGVISGKRISEGVYQLEGAVEKPTTKQAPSNLGIIGRYLFPPSIFEKIEKSKKGVLGELQLTDAIDRLARDELGIGVICLGDIFDVGTPQGYFTSLMDSHFIANFCNNG